MTWCRRHATRHYLSQYWASSVLPYDLIIQISHICVLLLHKNDSQTRTQFCTCHDGWAVVAGINLWPDWTTGIKKNYYELLNLLWSTLFLLQMSTNAWWKQTKHKISAILIFCERNPPVTVPLIRKASPGQSLFIRAPFWFVSSTENYECVTVLFSDIVSFTTTAALVAPIEIVAMLNRLFSLFDALSNKHNVYKVRQQCTHNIEYVTVAPRLQDFFCVWAQPMWADVTK